MSLSLNMFNDVERLDEIPHYSKMLLVPLQLASFSLRFLLLLCSYILCGSTCQQARCRFLLQRKLHIKPAVEIWRLAKRFVE